MAQTNNTPISNLQAGIISVQQASLNRSLTKEKQSLNLQSEANQNKENSQQPSKTNPFTNISDSNISTQKPISQVSCINRNLAQIQKSQNPPKSNLQPATKVQEKIQTVSSDINMKTLSQNINKQKLSNPELPQRIPQSRQRSSLNNQNSSQKSQSQENEKEPSSQQQQKDSHPDGQQKSQKQPQQSRSDRDQEQQKSGNDQQQERSGQQEGRKEEPSGKRCFNKLCQSKKIYKKLRSKVEHAKYRFLCRACYDNYVNNDFCQFCEQIYSSTGNSQDDDQWIGCDQCNRWNHIECEQKYRNKNIHELKDHDETPYLCLTCTYKAKQKFNLQNKQKPKKQYQPQVQEPRVSKPKIDYSKDQRIPVFNRKIQSLPSLEYFLQNYNFRLWINENLIKDDLQTLRELVKKIPQEGKRSTKKVKID